MEQSGISTWLDLVFTAVIAVATVLTWLIYREIAREAKWSREWQYAPMVVPELTGWRHTALFQPPSLSEATWSFTNAGRGAALAIRIRDPEYTGPHAAHEISIIEPGKEERAGAWLPQSNPYEAVNPLSTAPVKLKVAYRDVFGNEYETLYDRGRLGFRRLDSK